MATGMKYISKIPKVVPAGKLLCHNHVRPAEPINTNGFRAWLADPSDSYERCDCGWAGLEHYKGKKTSKKRATKAERLAVCSGSLLNLRKYLDPNVSVCDMLKILEAVGATIPLEMFQLATKIDEGNKPVKKTTKRATK